MTIKQDYVNVANMRHIWVLPEPLSIGWFKTPNVQIEGRALARPSRMQGWATLLAIPRVNILPAGCVGERLLLPLAMIRDVQVPDHFDGAMTC